MRFSLTGTPVCGMLILLGRSEDRPFLFGGMAMKTLYHNGRVYTGDLPLRSCFAVEDGRFVSVGEEISDADVRIDLGGAFVCAGFNDSHMHLLNLGQSLTAAPLGRHTASLEDMLSCLSNTKPGRGGWILGRGWNQDLFADGHRMPDRHDLDRVSLKSPVCAVRACGRALAVNTKALELLGITGETEVPGGGAIQMEDGHPIGLFFDNAMDLVLSAIPAPDKEDVKEMIRLACRELNRYGITSCQSDDYCVFQNLSWQVVNEAFRELEAAGELTVRVYEQANFTDTAALEEFIRSGCATGTGSDRFRIGPLKLLGDGALGARTAYLSRPYADDPSTRGLSVFTQREFDDLIGLANRNGMQVAVHCIGDACLDLVLDSLEKALAECPRQDHRHGIVHCQITRPEQLRRIAQNRLHVYAQSIFLDYDLHIVNARAGEALASSSYSWKRLMDLGATVSNGSDCPVEMPDVLAGIQCAVTRRDRQGRGPYLPEQAFTVRQALDSFTKWGAWASFEEDFKGRIAPGMAADFTVLGADPFGTPPEKLQDIPVAAVYLAGYPVYQAENGNTP